MRPGSLSSSFRVILAAERKNHSFGGSVIAAEASCCRTSKSGESAEFLAELHRLRSSPRPEFVRKHDWNGVFTVLSLTKSFLGNFAIAQALGRSVQGSQAHGE